MLRYITCKLLHYYLQKLFVANPDKRLGGGGGDGQEVRAHPWFAGVDWNQIYNKAIKPPFKPRLGGEDDVRYIDPDFTKQVVGATPDSYSALSKEGSQNQGLWKGFSYES